METRVMHDMELSDGYKGTHIRTFPTEERAREWIQEAIKSTDEDIYFCNFQILPEEERE